MFNRDVIDLAMMRPTVGLLDGALLKADAAYGPAVRADLDKALAKLTADPAWLEVCMRAMKMNTVMPAELLTALKNLKNHLKRI